MKGTLNVTLRIQNEFLTLSNTDRILPWTQDDLLAWGQRSGFLCTLYKIRTLKKNSFHENTQSNPTMRNQVHDILAWGNTKNSRE